MARLQEAQKRLDKALAHLEQATGGQNGALQAELTAVQNRCTVLEDSNRDVALRLDAAIERVREILNS